MTKLLAAIERHINRRTRRYVARHPRFKSAAVTTRKAKP